MKDIFDGLATFRYCCKTHTTRYFMPLCYVTVRTFYHNDSLWTSAKELRVKHIRSATKAMFTRYNFIHHEKNDMSCFRLCLMTALLNQINPYTNYLCTTYGKRNVIQFTDNKICFFIR